MGTLGFRFVLAAALALAMLCLVGCPTQESIGDINRDPGRFAGKEITIKGQASDAFGGLAEGLFSSAGNEGYLRRPR